MPADFPIRNKGQFQPGQPGGPGRPKGFPSIRELLRKRPLRDKRQLVENAYKYALAGDARWAEWIARYSGEGDEIGSGIQILIRQVGGGVNLDELA